MIGELKHQAHGAQETTDRLSIDYSTETISSSTLRDELVSYQRKLSELKEKYEINQRNGEDTETKLNLLQQRIEELSRENGSIHECKALIVVEVINQRNKIAFLRQQLDDAKDKKESLRRQLFNKQSKGEGDAHVITITEYIAEMSERSMSMSREKEVLDNQQKSLKLSINESTVTEKETNLGGDDEGDKETERPGNEEGKGNEESGGKKERKEERRRK